MGPREPGRGRGVPTAPGGTWHSGGTRRAADKWMREGASHPVRQAAPAHRRRRYRGPRRTHTSPVCVPYDSATHMWAPRSLDCSSHLWCSTLRPGHSGLRKLLGGSCAHRSPGHQQGPASPTQNTPWTLLRPQRRTVSVQCNSLLFTSSCASARDQVARCLRDNAAWLCLSVLCVFPRRSLGPKRVPSPALFYFSPLPVAEQ